MSGRGIQPWAVMLELSGRLAVVVGSGPAALRVARTLRSHGADVCVVAPDPGEDVLCLEREGELVVERREYRRGDLDGALLAFAMSGSARTDGAVAAEARESGVLVNVQGDAGASDFIVPSLVSRGALQIAVSTGGAAPWIAREVRRGIAAAYGPEWEAYTALLAEVRACAIEREGMSEAEAAELVERASAGVLERLAAGEAVTAAELLAGGPRDD